MADPPPAATEAPAPPAAPPATEDPSPPPAAPASKHGKKLLKDCGPAAAGTAVGGETALVLAVEEGSDASSDDIIPPVAYKILKVREYLDGKQWIDLESYLKTFVTCEESKGDSSTAHAALFLHCRRGRAMQILDQSGEEAAHEFYINEIVNLSKSASDFVVPKELKKDVDAIGVGIKNKELAQPKDLETIIDDYMRLYFPDTVGHIKKVSELWQFAVSVDVEDTLSSNKKKRKPGFRCLACQRVFKNHTITIMRDHFVGGNCTICPKKTPNIRARLDKIPGQTKQRQRSKKGKGTKGKCKDQDDPMKTCDSNLDMAQKAYNHVLVAIRHSVIPNVNRDELQGNLTKAVDFLESLIKSLEASKESATGHQPSPQITDNQQPAPSVSVPHAMCPEAEGDFEVEATTPLERFGMDNGNVLQTDLIPQQRADAGDAEIGFSPPWGSAAHQTQFDREHAFTPEKSTSHGQLHSSFGSGSAFHFQQLGASTSASEHNHGDLDSSE